MKGVWGRITNRSQKKKENAAIAAASAQALKEAQQPSGYGNELQILSGHTDIVRHIMRVDDRLLVSASDDRTAIVWDCQTGECVHKLEGHKHPITCMLLLEDKNCGSLLLTGSSDKDIRVWNLQTGVCQQVLHEHEGSVKCLCLMQDPSKGASSKQQVLDPQPVSPRAVSPSLSSSGLVVNTPEKGKTQQREQHWFCSGGNDKNVHIWHQGSDGMVRRTGTIVRVEEENMNCMLAVNSSFVVTGSSNVNILQVYSLESMSHHRFLSYHREAPQCLERLSDQAFVSGSLDGMIVVWHAEHMTPIRVLNNPDGYLVHNDYPFCVRSLAFVAGQFLLAAVGNGFALHHVETGTVAVSMENAHEGPITAIAMADSCGYVLTSSDDGTIRLWALPKNIVNDIRQARMSGTTISLSSSLTPSRSGYTSVSKPTLVKLLHGHSGSVTQIIPLSTSSFASCSSDNYVILWKDSVEETELRNNHAALMLLQQSSMSASGRLANPEPILVGSGDIPVASPSASTTSIPAASPSSSSRVLVPAAGAVPAELMAASPSANIVVAASPTVVCSPVNVSTLLANGGAGQKETASAGDATGLSFGAQSQPMNEEPKEETAENSATTVPRCAVHFAELLYQEKKYTNEQIEAELKNSGFAPEVIAPIMKQLTAEQQNGGSAATGTSLSKSEGDNRTSSLSSSSLAPASTAPLSSSATVSSTGNDVAVPEIMRKLFY